MYLHRLIRILPILAIAILVYTKLMGVVAGGPLLKDGYSDKSECQKSWFWTLLFVVNYTKHKVEQHSVIIFIPVNI